MASVLLESVSLRFLNRLKTSCKSVLPALLVALLRRFFALDLNFANRCRRVITLI